MIATKHDSPLRPYWHVDLKWVCGILLFFALGGAMLFYNLAALTERERAVTMSATVIASLFSKDGLDDEKDVIEFKKHAATLPGDVIAPIPQFPFIQISKHDLESKSPRDLRLAIFRQLTEPIYDKGLKGAAAQFSSDPVSQEQFQKDATLLGVFTKTTHDALQTAFFWTAVAACIFLALLVYFSAGWGRLVSPAVILLFASPLGTLLGLLLLYPPKDGSSPYGSLPTSVAEEIGTSLSQSYFNATLLGVALLVVAGIGKVTKTVMRRRKVAQKSR